MDWYCAHDYILKKEMVIKAHISFQLLVKLYHALSF